MSYAADWGFSEECGRGAGEAQESRHEQLLSLRLSRRALDKLDTRTLLVITGDREHCSVRLVA